MYDEVNKLVRQAEPNLRRLAEPGAVAYLAPYHRSRIAVILRPSHRAGELAVIRVAALSDLAVMRKAGLIQGLWRGRYGVGYGMTILARNCLADTSLLCKHVADVLFPGQTTFKVSRRPIQFETGPKPVLALEKSAPAGSYLALALAMMEQRDMRELEKETF